MRRADRDDWDDWDDGDDWDGEGRRKWPFILLVGVAVVSAVILVGPRVLSKFDQGTEPGVAVPTSTVSTGSTSLTITNSTGTNSTATTQTPPTTSQTSVVPTPPVELTALQTVPAVRDLIVVINGQDVASDGSGLIPLTQDQRRGTIEFVGLVATPALMQVELVGWSDGETASTRSLDTLPGPVAQIGLVVSTRVKVTLADPSLVADQVVFSSEAGDVDVDLGVAQWLPARRAIEAADGFVEQALTYVSELVIGDDGQATRLPRDEFQAAPEITWVVKAEERP